MAQIVRNAQALGHSLDELGTPVEAREFGYTRSHMIAVNVAQWAGGVEVAKRLENEGKLMLGGKGENSFV